MAIRDLLEQRAATVQAMRQLTDHPEGDGGDLSDSQVETFDRHKAELERTEAAISRQQAVDDAERRMAAPAIISGNGRDGQFEERARSFSIVKAINAQLGEPVDAGFEREISAEVRTRARRPFMGIAVPDQVFLEKRVLTVGAGAADLYPVQHRPDLFIDRLRSSLIVGRLGATVLDGLVGDQEIPRQLTSSTAEHLAEEAALTPSDATFDDVELSPKTVGAVTSYSRRTLINAQPSIEALVRADLAAVIAREIDFQALFGDGLANNPTGIANQTDVHTGVLSTPTWVQVLGMIAQIETADAALAGLGWAMSPAGVAVLRGTQKLSATDSVMLMEDPGSLAGYPAASTTAIPALGSPATATSVFFGAWSQLLVGYWSGIDLLLNPYESASYLRGRVMLRALRDYDVAVRHGESFTVAADLPL